MLGQTSFANHQPALSQHVASQRSTRLQWTGCGFAVLMLMGLSARGLLPQVSHTPAKPTGLAPELAFNFNPSLPLLGRGGLRPAMAKHPIHTGNSHATGLGALPGAKQQQQRQSMSVLHMRGGAGEPSGEKYASPEPAHAGASPIVPSTQGAVYGMNGVDLSTDRPAHEGASIEGVSKRGGIGSASAVGVWTERGINFDNNGIERSADIYQPAHKDTSVTSASVRGGAIGMNSVSLTSGASVNGAWTARGVNFDNNGIEMSSAAKPARKSASVSAVSKRGSTTVMNRQRSEGVLPSQSDGVTTGASPRDAWTERGATFGNNGVDTLADTPAHKYEAVVGAAKAPKRGSTTFMDRQRSEGLLPTVSEGFSSGASVTDAWTNQGIHFGMNGVDMSAHKAAGEGQEASKRQAATAHQLTSTATGILDTPSIPQKSAPTATAAAPSPSATATAPEDTSPEATATAPSEADQWNFIKSHMNEDHADSLLAYAIHYSGLLDAQKAVLDEVSPEGYRMTVSLASGETKQVLVPLETPVDDIRGMGPVMKSMSANARNEVFIECAEGVTEKTEFAVFNDLNKKWNDACKAGKFTKLASFYGEGAVFIPLSPHGPEPSTPMIVGRNAIAKYFAGVEKGALKGISLKSMRLYQSSNTEVTELGRAWGQSGSNVVRQWLLKDGVWLIQRDSLPMGARAAGPA